METPGNYVEHVNKLITAFNNPKYVIIALRLVQYRSPLNKTKDFFVCLKQLYLQVQKLEKLLVLCFNGAKPFHFFFCYEKLNKVKLTLQSDLKEKTFILILYNIYRIFGFRKSLINMIKGVMV